MTELDGPPVMGVRELSDCATLVKQPVVSVLMLAYNHAPYIAQAIDSVLAQRTTVPIELIIGEDASTDATHEIVTKYQREFPTAIRVISSDRNVGMHANHARLIDAARGEFIAYCEGDDYWIDPWKLQHQVDYLRAHPEAGAVHTDFDHIVMLRGRWRRLSNFQKTRFGERGVPINDIFAKLLCGNFIQTCTLCVRANLSRNFLDGGLLKDSYSVGDWPLCLYIAARHKFGYLPQSTAVYRKVPGSMMNAGSVARLRTITGYVAMIEDFCDRFEVSRINRINAMAEIYRPMLSVALFAGDAEKFAHCLAWLQQHDAAYANSWRGRLLPWLAKSPVARWVLSRIQELRARSREAREYR